MSVGSVNSSHQTNSYYIEPKKTKTGRFLSTSLGLAGTALTTGVLLNTKDGFFNPSTIAKEAESTGIKAVDNQITKLKTLKIQRYLPLALGASAVMLLSYGLGAAIDNVIYNKRVKNAQKRAYEQQREVELLRQRIDTKV